MLSERLQYVYVLISTDRFKEVDKYTSQLNREISHDNIVALKEVILEDKSIYMVFEYAEHDFLVSYKFHHSCLDV